MYESLEQLNKSLLKYVMIVVDLLYYINIIK